MSRNYAPPLATLVQYKTQGGGAYAQDATISLVITPLLPVPVKDDLIVGGGWGPSARRRDASDVDATGKLTSFSIEG